MPKLTNAIMSVSREERKDICEAHATSIIFQVNAVTYLFDDGLIKIRQRGKALPSYTVIN